MTHHVYVALSIGLGFSSQHFNGDLSRLCEASFSLKSSES